jgi:hypothetical protein
MRRADFALPLGLVVACLGLILALALANGSNAFLLLGAAVACGLGVGSYACLAYNPTALPDPKLIAAENYWKAYTQAHDGIGQSSPSADDAARSFKGQQSKAFALGTLCAEGRLTDEKEWRFALPQSLFQPGQSSASYWRKIDEAYYGAPATPHRRQVRRPSVPSRDRPASASAVENVFQFQGSLPPHLALIRETNATRAILSAAAKAHGSDLGTTLSRMLVSVDAIVLGLKDDPLKLYEVQRLFTYYLPEVGRMLEARRQMQAIGRTSHVDEIDAILGRVELTFQQFATRMHQADIRELEIDLRLLDQALAAEFETGSGRK